LEAENRGIPAATLNLADDTMSEEDEGNTTSVLNRSQISIKDQKRDGSAESAIRNGNPTWKDLAYGFKNNVKL
jgi:hypothetical protein